MIGRVFIAIAVPPVVRDALAQASVSLRAPGGDLRPTVPAGWHCTLAFLGDLDEDRVALATQVTGAALEQHAPRPAPWLALGAAGRFGDRVLVVHVSEDPPGALRAWVEVLRDALGAVGFDLPPAAFRPHVTLARARRSRRVTRADVSRLVVPDRRWQPSTVGLWAAAGPGASRPYEVRAELAWPGDGSSSGDAAG